MIYTIIAYKENFSDSCGGYDYDSDFSIDYFEEDELEQAIEHTKWHLYENTKSRGRYQMTVLYNGKEKDRYDFDEQDSLPDILDVAQERASAQYKVHLDLVKAKQERAEAERQEQERLSDLKLLAKLKAQYGE